MSNDNTQDGAEPSPASAGSHGTAERPDEPTPAPPTIRPGGMHAREAYRRGREDEYIDNMRNRYGGEW
jgi:hypothetical protein